MDQGRPHTLSSSLFLEKIGRCTPTFWKESPLNAETFPTDPEHTNGIPYKSPNQNCQSSCLVCSAECRAVWTQDLGIYFLLGLRLFGLNQNLWYPPPNTSLATRFVKYPKPQPTSATNSKPNRCFMCWRIVMSISLKMACDVSSWCQGISDDAWYISSNLPMNFPSLIT